MPSLLLFLQQEHPGLWQLPRKQTRITEQFVYFGLSLLFLPRATLTFKGKVLATYCIESVCRKVLVAGGATGVASVRSCQKLSLCLMDSRAADYKVDPPLVKAKPISNGSSVYGITGVRRGKISFNCGQREEWEYVRKRPLEVTLGVTPLLPFWSLLSTSWIVFMIEVVFYPSRESHFSINL